VLQARHVDFCFIPVFLEAAGLLPAYNFNDVGYIPPPTAAILLFSVGLVAVTSIASFISLIFMLT
jgi:hypothetical protein